MAAENVRRALAELPSIARLFGRAIEARLNTTTPDSLLLRMLETRPRILDWLENRACKYLTVINSPEIAITSLNSELLGHKAGCFDEYLKDALAEVCAVVELSERGGTGFTRIPRSPDTGKKTPDFECCIESDTGELQPYCVEAKNCRAPVGVLDVIKGLYDERAKTAPDILKRSIELLHSWDNTVNKAQECTLKEFFYHLSTCSLPFESVITIKDEGKPVEIRARVREGSGVSLTRAIGGDMPWGPFIKRQKFLAKALEKIHTGSKQLKTRPDRKSLLVLNIESPDGTVESDLLSELRQAVAEEFATHIEIAFMLSYKWVNV